jgi:hypothetical protein
LKHTQEKLQIYSSFERQTHVGINSNLFYIYSVFDWRTHKPMSAVRGRGGLNTTDDAARVVRLTLRAVIGLSPCHSPLSRRSALRVIHQPSALSLSCFVGPAFGPFAWSFDPLCRRWPGVSKRGCWPGVVVGSAVWWFGPTRRRRVAQHVILGPTVWSLRPACSP